MEEKKKEIKMEVSKGKNTQQKLSYDELNQACAELSQQNQQMQVYIKKLHAQIQELGEANMMKRLDYLFAILKYSNMFTSDFVGECVEEIQEALTISEQEKTENKQD